MHIDIYRTSKNNYLNYIHHLTLTFLNLFVKILPSLDFFSSEDEFIRTISRQGYAYGGTIYSSAVIFSSGSPGWAYSVRLNRTYTFVGGNYAVPDTSRPNIDIAIKSNRQASRRTEVYNAAYLRAGTFALMDFVNSFIATMTCRDSNKCSTQDIVSLTTEGVVDFPNPDNQGNGFWGSIGAVFAIFMIIALLYPFANVIKELVTEKETKIREGMLMMALRNDALWVSWIFHFMCLFLPLSIILALAGSSLFSYSRGGPYIWFYFITFFISATSYCVLISNFFSKARTASIVGCLIFLAGKTNLIYINALEKKSVFNLVILDNLFKSK